MFSRCEVRCCICGTPMDFMRKYGRDTVCCGQECFKEFERRHTRAIMGKAGDSGGSEDGPA